jgi:HD superfamily phosphohydrolase YqeK
MNRLPGILEKKGYIRLMISKTQENNFIDWFHQYSKTFYSNDLQIQRNLDLKYEHILRVRDLSMEIAASEGLTDGQIRLASVIGLFHDIGRFLQYTKYGTFADSKSENHALLGIRELKKNKVLHTLEHDDRNLILTAIADHNRKEILPTTTGKALFYSRLLRDADKIDIWRVVIDYYEAPKTQPNNALQLDLLDMPTYSFEILKQVENGSMIRIEDLSTLNDFKLLQAAWIFDLTCMRSYELVKQRHYIERLFAVLPDDEPLRQLQGKILFFIESKIKKGQKRKAGT